MIKRILLFVFVLLVACAPAYGLIVGFSGPPSGGAASCETSVHSQLTDTASWTNILGSSTANVYVASAIDDTDAATICRIDVALYYSGSPTMNLYAELYTDSTGPNAQTGATSDAVDASTITATDAAGARFAPTTFTFSTPVTTSDTTVYYVVVWADDYDSGNYVVWAGDRFGTYSGVYRDDDGTGTWTTVYTDRALNYQVFKE